MGEVRWGGGLVLGAAHTQDGLRVRVPDIAWLPVGVQLGVSLGLLVRRVVGERVVDGDCEGVGVGLGERDGEAERRGVGEGLTVAVGVWEGAGEGERERVGEGLGVAALGAGQRGSGRCYGALRSRGLA